MLRLVVSLALLCGCNSGDGEPKPDADLTVAVTLAWTLADGGGQARTCSQANAQNVVINYKPVQGGSVISDVASCNAGSFTFQRVDSFTYNIDFFLRDANSQTIDTKQFMDINLTPGETRDLGAVVFTVP